MKKSRKAQRLLDPGKLNPEMSCTKVAEKTACYYMSGERIVGLETRGEVRNLWRGMIAAVI
jgi:hypothetical protein